MKGKRKLNEKKGKLKEGKRKSKKLEEIYWSLIFITKMRGGIIKGIT